MNQQLSGMRTVAEPTAGGGAAGELGTRMGGGTAAVSSTQPKEDIPMKGQAPIEVVVDVLFTETINQAIRTCEIVKVNKGRFRVCYFIGDELHHTWRNIHAWKNGKPYYFPDAWHWAGKPCSQCIDCGRPTEFLYGPGLCKTCDKIYQANKAVEAAANELQKACENAAHTMSTFCKELLEALRWRGDNESAEIVVDVMNKWDRAGQNLFVAINNQAQARVAAPITSDEYQAPAEKAVPA